MIPRKPIFATIAATVNTSTYGPTGADYVEGELSLWESDTDVNLVSITTIERLSIQLRSGETFSSYTDNIALFGGTTNKLYHREIVAEPGAEHKGLFETQGVKIHRTSHTALSTQESNLKIRDVIFEANSVGNNSCINILSVSGCEFKNCVFIVNGGANAKCVNENIGGNKYICCIGWDRLGDFGTAGSVFSIKDGSLANQCMAFTDSTTAQGFTYDQNVEFINCLSNANSVSFSGTASNSSRGNLSKDTSAPGADSLHNIVIDFEDKANGDFRPKFTETYMLINATHVASVTTGDIAGNSWGNHYGIGAFKISPSSRRKPANENVSTCGVGQDYEITEMTLWEADTDVNLVSAKQGEGLHIVAGSYISSTNLSISGSVVDKFFFRRITADSSSKHAGDFSSGVRIEFSSSVSLSFNITEQYFSIHDLNVFINATVGLNKDIFRPHVNGISVTNILSKDTNDEYVFPNSSNGESCFIANCVGINAGTNAFRANGDKDGRLYFYNNLTVGSADGFEKGTGSRTLINNIAQDSTNDDIVTDSLIVSKNNITSDSTGEIQADIQFVDAVNDDYRLSISTDTEAIGQGIDLSDDPNFPFCDNIAGEIITSWNIGPYGVPPVISLLASLSNTSLTPSAALSIGRQIISNLSNLSATPDVDLITIRGILGSLSNLSLTPDVDLITIRGILSNLNVLSLTSDSELNKIMAIIAMIQSTSLTPDAEFSGVTTLIAALLNASETGDIDAIFDRHPIANISGSSLTGDAVIEVFVDQVRNKLTVESLAQIYTVKEL